MAVSASACGGGGDDDGGAEVITIEPVLEERPEGMSEEDAVQLVLSIMERRGEFIDGSAEATANDDGTIDIEYSGIAADIARDLFLEPGSASADPGATRAERSLVPAALVKSGSPRTASRTQQPPVNRSLSALFPMAPRANSSGRSSPAARRTQSSPTPTSRAFP
jgi:hypothetical protein